MFTGNQEDEFRWFALGATLPGVSMEVGRAARQIISALKARRRALTLSWTAQLAMRVHGAFPDSSQRIIGYVNQVLPDPAMEPAKIKGARLDKTQSTLLRALASFGNVAVETQHENLTELG